MKHKLFVHLTLKSKNEKTGNIPVSTTTAKACPSTCPFNNKNGCYAESGPLAIHWRKVTEGERGTDWNTFCDSVSNFPEGQLWRANQAGDLPHNNGKVSRRLVRKLVDANKGRKGFGYTHHLPHLGDNSRIIKHANKNGFTINLSANNLSNADEMKALGIAPVVTVLPSTVNGDETPTVLTPQGNKVVVCPATYRDNVNCASCGLCQKSNRSCIVGFPAHGSMKKRVDKASI